MPIYGYAVLPRLCRRHTRGEDCATAALCLRNVRIKAASLKFAVSSTLNKTVCADTAYFPLELVVNRTFVDDVRGVTLVVNMLCWRLRMCVLVFSGLLSAAASASSTPSMEAFGVGLRLILQSLLLGAQLMKIVEPATSTTKVGGEELQINYVNEQLPDSSASSHRLMNKQCVVWYATVMPNTGPRTHLIICRQQNVTAFYRIQRCIMTDIQYGSCANTT
jgi:hypothetical protein